MYIIQTLLMEEREEQREKENLRDKGEACNHYEDKSEFKDATLRKYSTFNCYCEFCETKS